MGEYFLIQSKQQLGLRYPSSLKLGSCLSMHPTGGLLERVPSNFKRRYLKARNSLAANSNSAKNSRSRSAAPSLKEEPSLPQMKSNKVKHREERIKELTEEKLGTSDVGSLEYERGGYDMYGEQVYTLSRYFDIVRFVGSGSYGVVFAGVDRKSGENCAIKIIKKGNLSDHQLELVRQEANILKRLDHPNIVKFKQVSPFSFQLKETQAFVFIVMELANGHSLRHYISTRTRQKKSLSDEESAQIMRPILSAVAHIHSRGFIHRDLKPENIVIDHAPDSGAVFGLKIIDFGLTAINKACNAHFHKITERCGTLIYMAPEQARQDHYGKPVDLWACGIIMFTLLNKGAHPTYKRNVMTREEFFQALQKSKADSWKFSDRFSKSAISLFKRMCSFNPSDRYSAAIALQHPWITRDAKGKIPLTLMEELKAMEVHTNLKKAFHAVSFLSAVKAYGSKLSKRQKSFVSYEEKVKKVQAQLQRQKEASECSTDASSLVAGSSYMKYHANYTPETTMNSRTSKYTTMDNGLPKKEKMLGTPPLKKYPTQGTPSLMNTLRRGSSDSSREYSSSSEGRSLASMKSILSDKTKRRSVQQGVQPLIFEVKEEAQRLPSLSRKSVVFEQNALGRSYAEVCCVCSTKNQEGSKRGVTVFQFGCPHCRLPRKVIQGRSNSTVGRKFKTAALNNVQTPLEKALNVFSPAKVHSDGLVSRKKLGVGKSRATQPPIYPKSKDLLQEVLQKENAKQSKYSSLVSEDSSVLKAGSRTTMGGKSENSARSTSSLSRGQVPPNGRNKTERISEKMSKMSLTDRVAQIQVSYERNRKPSAKNKGKLQPFMRSSLAQNSRIHVLSKGSIIPGLLPRKKSANTNQILSKLQGILDSQSQRRAF